MSASWLFYMFLIIIMIITVIIIILFLLSSSRYDVNTLNIMYQKCSDSEVNFILNNGKQIYTALFHNLEYGDNSTDNIDHVFTTLALICTEFTSQRMLPDFFHFLMSVQVCQFFFLLFICICGRAYNLIVYTH